jgi:glyoxylase-like metal-dependent hydrolase (beta-lactamase superfamily II)
MLHESPRHEIDYVHADTPEPGDVMAMAPGIHWLRMPLPFALTHINLWLFEEDTGWSIVDTGACTEECRTVWRRVFSDVTRQASIDRVIVTHMHPDHSGCAGWLCEHLDAGLSMTREEYTLCRTLTAGAHHDVPASAIDFYKSAGFPEESLKHYQRMFGMFAMFVSPLPDAYSRLEDGGRIDVNGLEWEIIVGRGHSPEHACLFSAERNLLISGDQLLPTISSNVSVYANEPDADPLADWLASLRDLKDRIPADVVVMPAHGRPFRGAHERLDELVAEHESGLDALETYCREPRRATDVFPVLFRGEIRGSNLVMATGESIAHLNYLANQGRIERDRDSAGVAWYRTRI